MTGHLFPEGFCNAPVDPYAVDPSLWAEERRWVRQARIQAYEGTRWAAHALIERALLETGE